MRKIITDNESTLIAKESEGAYKGLTYKVDKIHRVLMVFIPKSMRIEKTRGNTLCVAGRLVMTSMAWHANNTIGVLFPNTDRPFFTKKVSDYCKRLAKKYNTMRFAVRPQYSIAI